MSPREPVESPSCTGLVIGGMLISLVVFALAGFILYSSVCPCGDTPGGFLFGERAQSRVTDWEFVDAAPLCQVQVWQGLRPYSLHVACMAGPDVTLLLSCIDCASADGWEMLETAHEALLRHNGVVYPVVLAPVGGRVSGGAGPGWTGYGSPAGVAIVQEPVAARCRRGTGQCRNQRDTAAQLAVAERAQRLVVERRADEYEKRQVRSS